jgi:autotransporter passenger strand-loop-strand repeat protein
LDCAVSQIWRGYRSRSLCIVNGGNEQVLTGGTAIGTTVSNSGFLVSSDDHRRTE